ncbi:hypothetical protein ABTL07_19165, partial [Acinetobacter baumannii]
DLSEDDGAPSASIVDDEGFALVTSIAQDGRLYAIGDDERPIGPLRPGEARKMEWNWQDWKNDYWRVRPAAMPGTDIFVSSMPMYVDKDQRVFGRL